MKGFKFFVLFLVMFGCLCPMLKGYSNQSDSGILMKISGRVIQRETGLGVEGVIVHLDKMVNPGEYEAVTNKDGLFVIKKVPEGIYELNHWFIHLSCPRELILEKSLEPITVIAGRNVINLNIYLRKGASISGRVFKPDGVSPVTQGNVVVIPRLKGKPLDNKIDNNGYYRVVGLGRSDIEELNFSVRLEAYGYADLAKPLKIKISEELKDFNFVVGKGKIHIKGIITNSIDNNPIKGARISVFSVKRPNSLAEIADGNAVTDEAGNYSIFGFDNPVNVDIAVFSDDFEMGKVIKYLKIGVNRIDFKLTPKTKSLEPTERKEKAQLKCCDLKKLFRDLFEDITCKKTNSTDENGKPCIDNNNTMVCMVEKCEKDLIDIICREDCPKDQDGSVAAGYTPKYNSSDNRGMIVICINSKSSILWVDRMFHELYHICDREAPPNKEDEDVCAEARAYSAMICAFNNPQTEEKRRYYQKKCEDEKNS